MDATLNVGAHLVSNIANAVLANMRECYFPDEGPFARRYYPKHLDFFDALTDGGRS